MRAIHPVLYPFNQVNVLLPGKSFITFQPGKYFIFYRIFRHNRTANINLSWLCKPGEVLKNMLFKIA